MNFENLKKWITSTGGFIHNNIDIKNISSGNRAIISNGKINKEEKLFTIPKKLCINKEKIIEIPNSGSINTTYPNDVYSIIVLLYNIFVLKEKSFYEPYLSFLPSYNDFSYHPLFLFDTKKDIINELSPIIYTKLLFLKNTITKNFEIVTKINNELHLLPIDVLTFDNFIYCSLILQTRQWSFIGLVPLADLLQHSNNSSMFLSNNIEMTTPIDININDLIYDNYGLMDDYSLFSSFGFIDYSCDTHLYNVPINFNLKMETPLEKFVKNEISDLLKNELKFFIGSNGISVNLLKLVRISNINDFDLIKIKDIPKYFDNVISIENEQKSYSNLLALFKSLINDKFNIITNYPPNSIEYNLCYLNIHFNETLRKAAKILIVQWYNALHSPFSINMSID